MRVVPVFFDRRDIDLGPIGYKGENQVTEIRWDITKALAELEATDPVSVSGVWDWMGETREFPLSLSVGEATHTVSATDTSASGSASIQLMLTSGSKRYISGVYKATVLPSLFQED